MEVCTVGSAIIYNELDCPLLELSHRCEVIASTCILGSVSVVHECGSSCTIKTAARACIERELVTITSRKILEHDKQNSFYCFNIYCMHNTI